MSRLTLFYARSVVVLNDSSAVSASSKDCAILVLGFESIASMIMIASPRLDTRLLCKVLLGSDRLSQTLCLKISEAIFSHR